MISAPCYLRPAPTVAFAIALLGTITVGIERADAQVDGALGSNPWSIGIDTRLESMKFFGKNVGSIFERQTSFTLPKQEVRIGYQVSPALEVEVPFAISISATRGFSAQAIRLGTLANYRFATAPTLQPFVGGGGFVNYSRSNRDASVIGDQVIPGTSFSATQLAVRSQVGVDWYPLTAVSFRPTLFYEHEFESSTDHVAGYNTFGATFGTTFHFGAQSASAAAPNPVQLSMGFELSHLIPGSVEGQSSHSSTTLEVPSTYIGVFFPVTRDARLMLGANVQFNYVDVKGESSAQVIELQPRLEYNLNRAYRTERGVRIGAQFDYQTSSFHTTVGGQSFDQSLKSYGGGGDVSLTFPFGGSFLYRAGIGFDVLGNDATTHASASKTLSLKFGIDAR